MQINAALVKLFKGSVHKSHEMLAHIWIYD